LLARSILRSARSRRIAASRYAALGRSSGDAGGVGEGHRPRRCLSVIDAPRGGFSTIPLILNLRRPFIEVCARRAADHGVFWRNLYAAAFLPTGFSVDGLGRALSASPWFACAYHRCHPGRPGVDSARAGRGRARSPVLVRTTWLIVMPACRCADVIPVLVNASSRCSRTPHWSRSSRPPPFCSICSVNSGPPSCEPGLGNADSPVYHLVWPSPD